MMANGKITKQAKGRSQARLFSLGNVTFRRVLQLLVNILVPTTGFLHAAPDRDAVWKTRDF